MSISRSEQVKAAKNREELRQQLSKIVGRELTEQQALDLALKGVRVLEQVEREKRNQ